MVLKIENTGLTGYYLNDKFVDDPTQFDEENDSIYGCDESGLVFIQDVTGETPEKIELHYINNTDLEKKLSYIFMILTDK